MERPEPLEIGPLHLGGDHWELPMVSFSLFLAFWVGKGGEGEFLGRGWWPRGSSGLGRSWGQQQRLSLNPIPASEPENSQPGAVWIYASKIAGANQSGQIGPDWPRDGE